MKASVGDRLVQPGTHVGDPRRVGVITELRHSDGTPPYMVRWLDDGHEGLVFPGPDALVEAPQPPQAPHPQTPRPQAPGAEAGKARRPA